MDPSKCKRQSRCHRNCRLAGKNQGNCSVPQLGTKLIAATGWWAADPTWDPAPPIQTWLPPTRTQDIYEWLSHAPNLKVNLGWWPRYRGKWTWCPTISQYQPFKQTSFKLRSIQQYALVPPKKKQALLTRAGWFISYLTWTESRFKSVQCRHPSASATTDVPAQWIRILQVLWCGCISPNSVANATAIRVVTWIVEVASKCCHMLF